MINPIFKVAAFAVLSFSLACTSLLATEQSIAMKMPELPQPIKKAIHEKAGKAKIDGIEKVTDGGEVTYEVEIGRGAKAHSFTLDENGTLLDEEISLAEVPAPAQAAIKQNAGTGSIEGITKTIEDGKVSYEVDITRDGKDRSFTVDDKGKLIELQLLPTELPAVVLKALQGTIAGGKVGDINKEIDEDGITYEIEINPDAKLRTVTIDEKGSIVSDESEVMLAETPDAVQKAIKNALKDGALGDITKTTDEFGTNFDVDMKRSGKWNTVIITDDGQAVE